MSNGTEYKNVGSSCLVDFIGSASAESVASLFEILADVSSAGEEFENMGTEGTTHFGLEHYLGYVAAVIRVGGWMSRTQARNMNTYSGPSVHATADTAWGVMMAVANGKTKDVNPKFIPTKEDFDRGTSCKEYLQVFIDRELEKGELNDYFYNLNVICRMAAVDFKTSGIAASIIATVAREQGKEIERKYFTNLKETSKFFAQPKDKIVLKATLIGRREIEGGYGCTTIFKFVSEEGNVCIWFASGSFEENVWETGKEYILAGTVKGHEEYQGLKQTLLTRVSSVTQEWVDAEKAKAQKKAARLAKKEAK